MESKPPNGSSGGAAIRLVQGLLKLLRTASVSEIEVAYGHYRIKLRMAEGARPPRESLPAPSPKHGHPVSAPLTGTFYCAPSSTSSPYMREGEWVEAGQVVGLIEAMKVFNEIRSDVSGRVLAILAANGSLVQAGQPLIEVELGDVTARPEGSRVL
ncbi:MAG: hypothetical protein HYX89_03550 [Chloroflexi bacterium]|nr:hypothetical protein [Chloroflexota bacterium]